MAQQVKNLPAIQQTREMWVQSLGREKSPRGGNGNPLQYSCLENPMDRGAWWATVQRVSDMTKDTHTHLNYSVTPRSSWF